MLSQNTYNCQYTILNQNVWFTEQTRVVKPVFGTYCWRRRWRWGIRSAASEEIFRRIKCPTFNNFCEDFRPVSEDFRKFSKSCRKATRTFPNTFRRLPPKTTLLSYTKLEWFSIKCRKTETETKTWQQDYSARSNRSKTKARVIAWLLSTLN